MEELSETENKCKSITRTLPAWKMNEIVVTAVKHLCSEEFYEDDFDYQQMITCKDIQLRSFSSFRPENLQKFREVSLGIWNEGICLVAYDEETGKHCRMIAYNDTKNEMEIMQIILHEYAHIVLKHTEQSINGEMEAACFATAMILLLAMEQQFHFIKQLVKTGGQDLLWLGIAQQMNKKNITGGSMKNAII